MLLFDTHLFERTSFLLQTVYRNHHQANVYVQNNLFIPLIFHNQLVS